MNQLTGIKDADFLVLMQLNDYELTQVCQVNRYVQKLCNDDQFWRNRFIKTYSDYLGSSVSETLDRAKQYKTYLDFDTWKDMYIFFNVEKVKKLFYLLSHQTELDEHINDLIKKDLPIWVNRDLLEKSLRRDLILYALSKNANKDFDKYSVIKGYRLNMTYVGINAGYYKWKKLNRK